MEAPVAQLKNNNVSANEEITAPELLLSSELFLKLAGRGLKYAIAMGLTWGLIGLAYGQFLATCPSGPVMQAIGIPAIDITNSLGLTGAVIGTGIGWAQGTQQYFWQELPAKIAKSK